ncbi:MULTISPECIES: glycosyltransferase family 39 protein [unclassified Nitratiruptor]|uniref:ArnT family glycosyltransferase n=1 Tax=unclassified Nitratiruptor TaxID=2624044 RepID=UPI001915CCDF|nr:MULTISPECIES: glycosyltransferase family 39 protein [unclassified Nitratiruptor]
MPKSNFKKLLIIIIIIQIYRFFVLLNAQIDLYVDEAYYWEWSKNLSFGYYSKPPMIAWIIALFTSFCGDSQICIKLPALIFHPLSAIIIYLIGKKLFDESVGFWSGVAYITLPAVSLSSMIISTDVLLLFFWSTTLLFFIKALESDSWKYWLGAALFAGCGLLTKYTMIIFVLSVFFYLLWIRSRHLKNPKLYITMVLAALIYLPNLIWNARHQFITFVHTKNLSEIDQSSHFHLDKLFEFLGAQFFVFGPIFFGVFLYLIVRPKMIDNRYKLLYAFAIPFLAIISFQAFLSKALANWAAPTYVAATLLVVAYLLHRHHTKLLKLGILVNIVLALIFYHYHALTHTFHIELTKKNDPYKRVTGFHQLAQKLQSIVQKYPKTKLLFDDRTTMAEMIYYLKPHPFDAVMLNPTHHIGSQFHLTTDLQKHKGEDFIYITKFPINKAAKYFKNSKLLAKIEIPLYKDYKRVYYVYYLKQFKGYQ